jgi:hypothetical protein
MSDPRRKPDHFWFTRHQAAELLRLSPRQFDEAIRPRLPDDAVDGTGAGLRFYAPQVVQTFTWYRLERST